MKRPKLIEGVDFRTPLTPATADDIPGGPEPQIPWKQQVGWLTGENKRLKEQLFRAEAKIQAYERDTKDLVRKFQKFQKNMTDAVTSLPVLPISEPYKWSTAANPTPKKGK